jgi:hypothetical protein
VIRPTLLPRGAGLAIGAGAVLCLVAATPDARAGDEKTVVAAAVAHEKLVGVWKLDPELSEDPRAKMREAGGGRGPGGGGWGGGGGGGGWGGGHGGRGGGGGWGGGHGGGWGGPGGRGGYGQPGGGEAGVAEARGGAVMRPIAFDSQVTITNLTPEITMIDPEGGIRKINADNKTYKDDSGTEVKAHWEDKGLVVETKTARGGQVKEIWSVADEPRRLTVLVKVARPFGGDEVTVKRVFDPSQPETPRPAGQ